MTEELMSSNRRIQLLRERLELYNATIAEALSVREAERNGGISSTTADAAVPVRFEKKKAVDGPAPQLERDLRAEFSAARAPATTSAAATSVTTALADGGDSRRCERRGVVPPPPPPPRSPLTSPLNSGRGGGQVNSMSSLFCDDSSTAYTSGGDEEDYDERTVFVNPFLNEPVCVEKIDVSAVSSSVKDVEENCGETFRLSPPPAPFQKNMVDGQAKAKAAEEHGMQPEQTPQFATLETAYYKLSVAEQAIGRLQQLLDIGRFPRSLPQRQNSLRIAGARDELIKREQALRSKEMGSSSLSAIFHPAALSIEQQMQHMLAECETTKPLFLRVRERKASVEQKERLIKKKLNELEELQRDVRDKRQALVALERRNGQRETALIAREEKYRKDVEAHSERERSLQKKIDEVEELARKVSSWMKILDDRDRKTLAKEQRLRRVQADLVRRSEELFCYRSGRAKQAAPIPESGSAENS